MGKKKYKKKKIVIDRKQFFSYEPLILINMPEGQRNDFLGEIETEADVNLKEEIEKIKKSLLYAIEKDSDTGEVRIYPMNEENCIKLHGAEELMIFIYRLLDRCQT